MKFLIFAIVVAVTVAAISLKDQRPASESSQLCIKNCSQNRDPHCACKTEAQDGCKEFANKCLFEEFNCTSKNYGYLKQGKCSNVKYEIMIAPWCKRKSPNCIFLEICACRPTVPELCNTFGVCEFKEYNCTTQDFVAKYFEGCNAG